MTSPALEEKSVVETARSLKLEGLQDWCPKLEDYLYGLVGFRTESSSIWPPPRHPRLRDPILKGVPSVPPREWRPPIEDIIEAAEAII